MTIVTQIEESNFETVLTSEKLVVVDFTAKWCGPCRKITPFMEEIAQSYEDSVEVVKVDIDKSKSLAKKYGIRSIPAVLFFQNGNVVETIVGVQPYEKFASTIDKFI